MHQFSLFHPTKGGHGGVDNNSDVYCVNACEMHLLGLAIFLVLVGNCIFTIILCFCYI